MSAADPDAATHIALIAAISPQISSELSRELSNKLERTLTTSATGIGAQTATIGSLRAAPFRFFGGGRTAGSRRDRCASPRPTVTWPLSGWVTRLAAAANPVGADYHNKLSYIYARLAHRPPRQHSSNDVRFCVLFQSRFLPSAAKAAGFCSLTNLCTLVDIDVFVSFSNTERTQSTKRF